MRLYAKYRDEVKDQNKLQQYNQGILKVDDIQPTINQLNSNKKSKSAKKTSAYGRSIDYIAERGINLGKSIKRKTKKVFSSRYSKAIDHITKNELFPTVLNDKKDSSPSKGNRINLTKLLKRRKNDTKGIEDDEVEHIAKNHHCTIDDKVILGSEAAPLELCTDRDDLFTYTFVPKAAGIIDDTNSSAVNQIQDSCGQSSDMVWEITMNLSSIMILNEFFYGSKSNADIFHEEDTNDFVPIETCLVDDDTIAVHNLSHRNFDKIRFYDDPRARINNGAKCFVIKLVEILRRVRWYDDKFKPPIKMKGATSKEIIVPEAEGML